MKRFFIVVCLLAAANYLSAEGGQQSGEVTTILAAANTPDAEAVAAYNRGEEAYYRKNAFLEAMAAYEEAIHLNPNYADAYMGRENAISAYMEAYNIYTGKSSHTEMDYDKVAQLDPKYAGFIRAVMAQDEENYIKAIEEYTLAIRNKINLVEAYNRRGNCYRALGNPDNAIADYTEAIRLSPELGVLYSNRAWTYCWELHEYDKALADCNTAIRLIPNLFSAPYLTRAYIYYLKRDNNTRVITDTTQSISLSPHSLYARDAYAIRSLTHEKNGDLEKAISDVSEIIKLTGKLVLYINRRASLYEQNKQYDKALADYNEALRLDPDDAEAKSGRRRIQARRSPQ